MQTEQELYQLACSLQDTSITQSEIQTFVQTLQQRIDQQYLQKIRAATETQKQQISENPPREVTLLKALGAFTDDMGKARIEQICQGLLFAHTIQGIQQEVYTLSQEGVLLRACSNDNPSVSPQMIKFAGLCMILSLLEES